MIQEFLFWGYFKRRLAAKGGIRIERLPRYLADSVIDILKKCNRSNGRGFASSLSLKQCSLKIIEIYKSQII